MVQRFLSFVNIGTAHENAHVMAAYTNMKGINKFLGVCGIYHLLGYQHKLYAVTGGYVKDLVYTKLGFNLLKLITQIFLTDYQLPQFFQLNLFVRKSYYL